MRQWTKAGLRGVTVWIDDKRDRGIGGGGGEIEKMQGEMGGGGGGE